MSSPRQGPLVDIVIPVWNQPERTRRCIESLLRCTPEPFRVIAIDNGSEAETRAYLEQAQRERPERVRVLRNERNLGFVKATNQGIRAGDAPWVCLLNNDTVVTTGWLSELLRVAEANPEIGLLNPTSNSLGFAPQGRQPEQIAAGLRTEAGRWSELPKATGFCLLARRALLDKIGLLDESFGMGNFEDDDLSQRAKAAGLRCARARGAYVHHDEKTSFRLLPGWEKEFDRNRRQFESRWGKPLRILWAPPAPGRFPAGAVDRINEAGHWICFATREGVPDGLGERAQVAFLGAPPSRWRFPAALRLLTKRKKPFDLVISYDRIWSDWVRRLRPLHRARVLHDPTDSQVVDACRELSHG